MGIHALLLHLSSRVDPVKGVDRLALLGVDWYVMVHLIHPGRPVFYGSEVASFCQVSSTVGPLLGERYPGRCLFGVAICPCHTAGRPSSTCRGIPPALLEVDTVR